MWKVRWKVLIHRLIIMDFAFNARHTTAVGQYRGIFKHWWPVLSVRSAAADWLFSLAQQDKNDKNKPTTPLVSATAISTFHTFSGVSPYPFLSFFLYTKEAHTGVNNDKSKHHFLCISTVLTIYIQYIYKHLTFNLCI